MENAVGEFADEMDVVRDEDESSLIGLQREHEGLHGEDVQVGGGLIHQKKVGRVDEKLDEVQSRLLATAENGCFFVDIILSEKKGTQNAASFVFTECAAAGHDFLE